MGGEGGGPSDFLWRSKRNALKRPPKKRIVKRKKSLPIKKKLKNPANGVGIDERSWGLKSQGEKKASGEQPNDLDTREKGKKEEKKTGEGPA